MSDLYDPPPAAGEALVRPRPPQSWRERVEQLADATGTSPGRIAVGLALASAALVAAMLLLRPAPAPPEVSLPFASTTAPLSATTTTSATVVVHVAGAVVAPGLHVLASGARVADAIEAAGGLLAEADEVRINLAASVADGERVYVPVTGEDAPPVVVGSAGGLGASGGSQPSGPVNLNTADEEGLDVLPGVGPATASAIVKYRDQIGGFTSVDELLDVPGIGEAKLEGLRPLVTV